MNAYRRWLLWGSVLGALVGLLTAYLLVRRATRLSAQGHTPRWRSRPNVWLKTAVSLLGVIRQIVHLIE